MNNEEFVSAPFGVCVLIHVGLVNYLLGSHDSGTCRVRELRGLRTCSWDLVSELRTPRQR